MISFVVLHYLDLETTLECIENLYKFRDFGSTSVVIVDNGSSNGSYEKLKEISDDKYLYVISSLSNLGFAKGNNIGYLFAKNILHADTIIVMNNDVFVEDKYFLIKLASIASENKIDIIAPDIINLKGIHQNPFRNNILSGSQLIKKNVVRRLSYFVYRIPLVGKFKKYLKIIKNDEFGNNSIQHKLVMIVPHGACVIYTQNWVINENYAFIPDTFLFGEEDILFEYCIQKGYSTAFIPEISVLHLEDKATNMSMISNHKKSLFILKNSLQSTKILSKYRKKTKKDGTKYFRGIKL
ncbi:MAG: glycosyltransferase [Firmicutes bacterium]|nr:glycosyltransferase [Bacillota bacterium]